MLSGRLKDYDARSVIRVLDRSVVGRGSRAGMTMGSYFERQRGSGRALGFGFVVLLHVGLIWALAAGLGTKVVEAARGPIVAKIIDTPPEVKPDEAPPPPPPALDTPPPPFVPPPEITINLPPPPASHAIQAVQSKIAAPAAPMLPPRPDPTHPNGKPPYPPSSARMGEEGTVLLNVYVKTDGTVQEARILKSSGFSKLDQSAVKYAVRTYRYIPAMNGKTPVAAWFRVSVTFRMDDM